MKSVSSGFTLIELVVAMAVLSLLSLVVLQALSLAHRSWSYGTAAVARLDAVTTVQQSLRRSISRLLPLQDAHACDGNGSSMSFLAQAPGESRIAGTARYRLSVATATGGEQLVAQWCRYQAGQPACPAGDGGREVLLGGLASASFQYFHNRSWGASWTDCSDPPQLVRIDVRFPPRDRRQWPEFAVSPAYAAAADCNFDLVSMKCRSS